MKENQINKDELFLKEINQLDSIDSTVEKAIENMGTFYQKITKKLMDDGICFLTKEPLEYPFEIIEVPNKKIDKGMVAFVAINTIKENKEKEENEEKRS